MITQIFRISKVNVKVKLNIFATFCTLNALFNFAAWVEIDGKFKAKPRHRSQKGANGIKKLIENLHLIIYQYSGTLVHNGPPDILMFTDSQIDKRKGDRAVNGTKEVIRGIKTRVEPGLTLTSTFVTKTKRVCLGYSGFLSTNLELNTIMIMKRLK